MPGQSWVMKYCYPQKAGLPLCFSAIDFLLYFVCWLLFTLFYVIGEIGRFLYQG